MDEINRNSNLQKFLKEKNFQLDFAALKKKRKLKECYENFKNMSFSDVSKVGILAEMEKKENLKKKKKNYEEKNNIGD